MSNGSQSVFAVLILFQLAVLPSKVFADNGNLNSFNELERVQHKPHSNRSHLEKIRFYDMDGVLQWSFVEFEQFYANITQIVATSVQIISHDTKLLLRRLTNCKKATLDAFGNGELDVGDAVLSEIVVMIKHQIEEVKHKFHSLADNIDNGFDWAINQLNETFIENSSEYDQWTVQVKKKLRHLNDTELYKAGCKSIDDFMRRSTHELQKCCRITMKPMKTLCRNASSLLTEALHIAIDAMDRIQSCFEDKTSYRNYLMPCFALVYDNITSVLAKASNVNILVDKMLPMKMIYTKGCFAIVKVDMKRRQVAVEKDLFKDYKE